MKIGYARVSTQSQRLDSQLDALKNAGCEQVFYDVISGASKNRPQLNAMLNHLRSGDTVVVYKLDRLGRSLKDLIHLVNYLLERNVNLLSLSDNLDLSSSHGKFFFNIFAALAEFERDLIVERTKVGLEAARARGRLGGRPKGLSPKAENTAHIAELLYNEKRLSISQITNQLKISRPTLYRYLRHRGVHIGKTS